VVNTPDLLKLKVQLNQTEKVETQATFLTSVASDPGYNIALNVLVMDCWNWNVKGLI